jgi:predicted nucleic acid-binding protein
VKIVVDASAAISWALEDERDALARAMAAEVLAHGGYVPPLFASEIQNVLLLAIRRERTTLTQAAEVLGALARLPLSRLPLSVEDSALDLGSIRVLEMSISSGLSVYNATYVVLAQVLDARLMTRDMRMRTAASALNLLWEEATA